MSASRIIGSSSPDSLAFLKQRLVHPGKAWEGEHEGLLTESNRQIHSDLTSLLLNTVDDGTNQSALLLGAPGTGKTLVVEYAIANVRKLRPDKCAVVRLHDFYGDEKMAVKEAARQLCELQRLPFASTASFNENYHFLNATLRNFSQSHRSVIFVIDDFHSFLQFSGRTLFYTLVDALQSPECRATVLGISRRQDADHSLEKRIRSRFSHRRFLFHPPSEEEGCRLLQSALSLPSSMELHASPRLSINYNSQLETLFKDPLLHSILQRHLSLDRTVAGLFRLGWLALSRLDESRGYLTLEDFRLAADAMSDSPKAQRLRGLSVLELYLLATMRRLECKGQDEGYNFRALFSEYASLKTAGAETAADVYSEPVAFRAFQGLLDSGLIAKVTVHGEPLSAREQGSVAAAGLQGSFCATSLEFVPVRLLLSHSELEEGFKAHPSCPELLKKWLANDAVGRAMASM